MHRSVIFFSLTELLRFCTASAAKCIDSSNYVLYKSHILKMLLSFRETNGAAAAAEWEAIMLMKVDLRTTRTNTSLWNWCASGGGGRKDELRGEMDTCLTQLLPLQKLPPPNSPLCLFNGSFFLPQSQAGGRLYETIVWNKGKQNHAKDTCKEKSVHGGMIKPSLLLA